jgi:hypothetical protein
MAVCGNSDQKVVTIKAKKSKLNFRSFGNSPTRNEAQPNIANFFQFTSSAIKPKVKFSLMKTNKTLTQLEHSTSISSYFTRVRSTMIESLV